MSVKNIAQQAGYVTVGEGVQLYYESHGEGIPLVFVHAWSLSARLWKKRCTPCVKNTGSLPWT